MFVSSTFRDMQAERDELVKHVFPQLRRLCAERAVIWGEVDLRWGVTDEQRAEGRVLPICLEEIRRCRPFFIGLLGERYGWIPDEIPPELIEKEPWLAEHSGRSVTEMEILHGVLNDPAMADKALFYFRSPAYVDSLPSRERQWYREEATAEEVEQHGADEAQRRSMERRDKLDALKGRIRASDLLLREGYPTPQALGELVLADLSSIIDRLYPEGTQPDPLDREAAEHEAFARSRAGVYIGGERWFGTLDAHAQGDGPPLVVLGESGLGKSALLANWAQRHRTAHPDHFLLAHYIGASPYSADWAAMLRRIMGELRRQMGLEGEIPDQPAALRAAFANWLSMAAARGRIVLILDGLNQLEDRDQAPDLVWLPSEIPPNVRLVLATGFGRPLDDLKRRVWPVLEVQPLSPDERSRLIVAYLAQYTKALSPARAQRVAAAAQCANPLYLSTLLEELRLFGVHERLDERIGYYLQAGTVAQLYEKVLARYEEDYQRDRPGLVRDVMSLLWAARHGLSEPELLEMLGSDEQPLPRAFWSPLYLAAERALVDRSGLIGFGHDFLRDAVRTRYVPAPEDQRRAHLRLAAYFEPRALSERKVNELPWQLARAREWQRLYGLLADLEFFELAWAIAPFEVKANWVQIEASSPLRLVDAYQAVLSKPRDNVSHITSVATLLNYAGHPAEALRLRGYLVDYYRQTGNMHELAAALGNQAAIQWAQGDLAEAMALYKEAERLCRELGEMEWLAGSLTNQAAILQTQGDLDAAMALHQEVERWCRESGDKDGLRVCLGNQAVLLFIRGDPDGAMALHKEEERLCRELGNKDGLQHVLGNQAGILHGRGEVDEAMALFKEQERICRDLGNQDGLRYALNNEAVIHRDCGNLDQAMALHKEQERICRALGSRDGLQACLGNQAVILKIRGDLDRAMTLLKEQERLCRELSNKKWLSDCLGNQALILQDRGRLDEAMLLLKEQERFCRELGYKDGLHGSLSNQALIVQARGDLDGAMALHREAERLCRELSDWDGLATSLGNQASILRARGNLDGAVALLTEQERLCRKLRSKNGLARSLTNQGLVQHSRGDLDRALALNREAEQLLREVGNKDGLSLLLDNQSLVLRARGDLDGAMALSKEAESLCLELGNRERLQGTLNVQAGILFARGDVDGAIALYKKQERMCRESGSAEGLASALFNQAVLLARKKGQPGAALPLAEEAYRVAVRAGLAQLADTITPLLAALRR